MADSGDEQTAGRQSPTEGAEEAADSNPAAQDSDRVEPPGDEEAKDGLVEEVLKAISASSSPQPGEAPAVDLSKPESDSALTEEPALTQESQEGAPQEGGEEAVPSDPPASKDPPAGTASQPPEEEKPEAEAQGTDG